MGHVWFYQGTDTPYSFFSDNRPIFVPGLHTYVGDLWYDAYYVCEKDYNCQGIPSYTGDIGSGQIRRLGRIETTLGDGKWHSLEYYLKMNTYNQTSGTFNADGIHRFWIDGKLILETTNIPFSDNGSTVNPRRGFNYISFGGNNDNRWTTDCTGTGCEQWYAIDDIVISTTYIGPADLPPDNSPPTSPQNLSASAVLSSQINLSWIASTDDVGVTGYRIERCQGAACTNFTQIATPAGISYNDTGLIANTAYRYQVRAIDGAGNLSNYSTIVSVTTPPPDAIPPSVPAGFTATATSSSQIDLSWIASTDDVGVTGYRIYRDGSLVPSPQSLAPNYSDTGLAASTAYTYTVSAYDAAGNESNKSSSASATTLAISLTSGLIGHWKVDEGSGATASDSSGNGNTGALTNGPTWTTGKMGGALSFDGVDDYVAAGSAAVLDNINTFTYTAWIYPTTMGEGGYGAIVIKGSGVGAKRFLTNNGCYGTNGLELTVNRATAAAEACAAQGTIQLNTWQFVTATYSSADGSRLYKNGVEVNYASRIVGSGAEQDESAGNLLIGDWSPSSTGTFNGLIDDVRIYNRALTQTEITEIYNLGSGPADTTPPTVSITSPDSGSTVSGTVSVSASASDNIGVSGVQFKLDGTNLQAEDTTSPYSISWNTTTATNGSHTLTATARDAAGNQTTSSAVSVTVSNAADTQAPTVPINLTATAISSSQINLSWTASTDNVGVTGYKVYRCSGSGCAPTTQIATSAANSYSNTGLTASTAYTYTVSAYDAVGNESGKSNSVQAATQQADGTWQQTLEQNFDIADTFNELQDWTGSNVYYSYDPVDMPKKLDGSPSNWDLYSYQPGINPAPVGPWIGYHGVEYTWGGSGKSLVIDYEKPIGYGPARLGMYLGNGTPDSGYKKIHVFFMVKFHQGFFPLDQQSPPIFQNLMVLKFLQIEAGFVKPDVYQTPANRATMCLDHIFGSVYGANETFWNLFMPNSLDDLFLDEALTRVAAWNEGLGCYTNERELIVNRKVDEARFGSKYLANEWIGMEFMMDIGTLNNNDGSAEVWIYDQNGNETGHNLSTGISHMAKFNELYNKIVIGGNRQLQDPDTNEDRFYVDDFIINGSRIGPKYFSLLNGGAPPPKGDVQCDKAVDILDIQALVNCILGTGVCDWGCGNSADVNKDGSVDVLDVQEVVNIILGG